MGKVDLLAATETMSAARREYVAALGRACKEGREDEDFDSGYFESLHANECMADEMRMRQEDYDIWRHVANGLVGTPRNCEVVIRTGKIGVPRVVDVREVKEAV